MMQYNLQVICICLLMAMLVFGLASCGNDVNKDNILGQYKILYSYGVEEIRLSSGGEYFQSIKLNSQSDSKTRTGNWVFRKSDSQVVLENPMLVDNNFGSPRGNYWESENGTWVLTAKRSMTGKITLHWNDDLGYSFNKIN